MSRHTTFRFCLDPTVEQSEVLARHAGASRFAFNQCLRIIKTSLERRKANPNVAAPWSGFDLINTFNAWKKTEAAGRMFAVDPLGVVDVRVTGLSWRSQVCQQVFEEAAVDLGRALAAWSASRTGTRRGQRVGFPRFKTKTGSAPSFRLRNKHPKNGRPAIRVGDHDRARSVSPPGIGQVAVHDDTRRLRRMLAKDRAKILFATVSHRAGRWWVSLNVEAADLHLAHHHTPRADGDDGGWVGMDRGLSAFLVAATAEGTEVARVDDAPKARAAGMKRQRRLAKSLSRKQKGSRTAVVPPANWPVTIIASRTSDATSYTRYRTRWSRPTTDSSSKTSTWLACSTTATLPAPSPTPAGPSSLASWATSKAGAAARSSWPTGGTRPASGARLVRPSAGDLTLADRVFACSCGYSADRDLNAAVNLACWGQQHY